MSFIIDYLRDKLPLNRAVALATATVVPFAATGAGLVSAWLADHAPLIAEQIGPAQLLGIFITVATLTAGGIVTMAYRWLEGWMKHEDRLFQRIFGPTSEGGNEGPTEDRLRAEADKPSPGIHSVGDGEEYPGPRGI